MAAAAAQLPANVHVSKHPCLRAKLSQLRSKQTNARDTKSLVHDISVMLGTEALAELPVVDAGAVSLFSLSFARLLTITGVGFSCLVVEDGGEGHLF